MSEVNYRQQWAEGEIEAGTLLDAIDLLEHEKELMCQSRGVAACERDKAREERDAALAELAALKGGQEPFAIECGLSNGDGTYSVHIKRYPLPSYLEPHKDHPVKLLYTAPPAQASAWVPISERMPPETGHYLAYGPHSVLPPQVSHWLADCGAWEHEWLRKKKSEAKPKTWITHWQPLPAAPTPGASDGNQANA